MIAAIADTAGHAILDRQAAAGRDLGRAAKVVGGLEIRGLRLLAKAGQRLRCKLANADDRSGLPGKGLTGRFGIKPIADLHELALFGLSAKRAPDRIIASKRLEVGAQEYGSEAFATAWEAEVREAEATLRRETVHVAAGLLLPVWDKLPDDHMQVIRIAADDGRSLLGREIPATSLAELGTKLGLDISLEMTPDELAATVLRTGKSLPFRGVEELTLKRSLVNNSQRLELAGFSPARLNWYKAQSCFTEIIRYQTRLFVPGDRAAEVLASLAPRQC